ncbi:MAG TPA: alkaline phosphatase family protein [Terriglobales bacterium]|nr:alkaline phosphatase family protein [Terriglobales bacterium]
MKFATLLLRISTLILVLALCAQRPTLSVKAATNVQVKHVYLVVLENHSYSSIIGNANMPWLNALAKKYAYASAYYANTHPSIGNYFELTTGKIITNNDAYKTKVTADNIVRHLLSAGKTWKEYSEGLPSVGYTGGDTGKYTQHHNPLSYFSDVRDSSSAILNLVPFTQFATDRRNGTQPNYSFIVPNNNDNGHDCPANLPSCTDSQRLAHVDTWLKNNLGPLVGSSGFNATHGGLLVIVFDESAGDNTHGGGRVAWVVAGPDVKKAYVSKTFYQHQSTLRFLAERLGLTSFPGAAATAPNMQEFIIGN